MDNNFSQPQRQSPIGVLVLFFDTVRHFGRALLPLLAVWFLNRDGMKSVYVTLGLALIFVVVSVAAYLRYRNFTFYLDDANEEFIINEGVFNKTKTVVRLDKIQQVNITQSLLQRIISVYALEIDTAGGNNKQEASIKAVSHALALALKARLLENDGKRTVAAEKIADAKPVSEDRPFMGISLLSLLKVGVTSNYVRTFGVLFAFFFTVYESVKDVAHIDGNRFNRFFNGMPVMEMILIFVTIGLALLFVANVLRVILRYFNFKITRQSGSLLLSFGLINTKSTIIKPEKVQIVSVSRNYFQKKLDILELRIRQATGGGQEKHHHAIEIPGCNERERDAILKLLFRAIPDKGVMMTPNWRKLGFSIFLIIVLPLVGFYAFAHWVEPKFYQFNPFVLAYVVLILAVLWFGFRNYRLFISDRFIIKQSGAWDITDDIVEPGKIQAITTSQLFWHKTADIGYLTLHTAGGNIAFQLGDFTKIKHYVNLWLYEMEASDVNWM